MKTIYKYTLEITDRQTVSIPQHSKILSIQTQYDKPCMWVLVDPTNEKVDIEIEIIGTGHPVNDGTRDFIDTFQVQGGDLVFHVFLLLPTHTS